MKTETTVEINLNTNDKVVRAINEISSWLESNEPIPNHWIESKRSDTYKEIHSRLTAKSIQMLAKLVDI